MEQFQSIEFLVVKKICSDCSQARQNRLVYCPCHNQTSNRLLRKNSFLTPTSYSLCGQINLATLPCICKLQGFYRLLSGIQQRLSGTTLVVSW